FRHRAQSSRPSSISDSIVVTHPFHPLAGQRLPVVLERRRAGAERVLVCEGGPAGRVTLPVGWTDRVPAALSHRLGPEGLTALAELVAALQRARPPQRGLDRL
ncbi:MAG TPA: DUF5372 family protein, partial [Candidatus Dormibacteraeota bacterium]|nr:DUF5372 family protein [Candidatus Dormibacteraeota bacterium]